MNTKKYEQIKNNIINDKCLSSDELTDIVALIDDTFDFTPSEFRNMDTGNALYPLYAKLGESTPLYLWKSDETNIENWYDTHWYEYEKENGPPEYYCPQGAWSTTFDIIDEKIIATCWQLKGKELIPIEKDEFDAMCKGGRFL